MATTTTNYGLKKPDYNDNADIGVINDNMDIIDTKMKEIEDAGGGSTITVDTELSATSENPVQNKALTNALDGKAPSNHTHNEIDYKHLGNGNANDIPTKKFGIYTIYNYGNQSLPELNRWFSVINIPIASVSDDNFTIQLAFRFDTTNFYLRTCVAGRWSDWREI